MSIKKEMLNGVIWSAIEKYSAILVSLVISAILARLISPTDFGIIAVASVLINFLNIFTDMGIGPAIVQRKDLSDADLDSIFTFTLIGGFVLSLIFFELANPIANFFKEQKLVNITRVLSVNLFFAGLNIVPHADLLKRKWFKLIAKRTLLLQVTSGAISICAAYKGAGLYALLISPVFTVIGLFVFNFRYSPRKLDLTFNIAPLKKIFAFSIYQFLFSFVNYFSRNMDTLIIGRSFTLKELGFYDKSYRLMLLPLQNVTNVITPVMQPVLSSLQDNKEELSQRYNQIVKLISTISFPLSIFLFFTGGELIRIVYGNNWNEAVPVFRVLTLSLALQMILSTSGAIFQSANATSLLLISGLINTICTVSGFLIAAHFFHNIVSIAWAWDVTLIINMGISYLILYNIVLKSSLVSMLKLLLKPIGASIMIAIGLYIFQTYVSISDFPSMVIKFFVTVIIFFIVIQGTKHYDLIKIIKSRE